MKIEIFEKPGHVPGLKVQENPGLGRGPARSLVGIRKNAKLL